MDQLNSSSAYREQKLDATWSLLASSAGEFEFASELSSQAHWQAAVVPGTVAMSIAADSWQSGDYHDQDWWYKTQFEFQSQANGERHTLVFSGLATLTQVWLNQRLILTSQNMHLSYEVDVSDLLLESNELVLVFRALNPVLAQRQARPQWKSVFLEQQNLRFVRTTLIDKVQTWSPPIKLVGPWGGITLRSEASLALTKLNYHPSFNVKGGVLTLDLELQALNQTQVLTAQLQLGPWRQELILEQSDGHWVCRQQCAFPMAKPWWPHNMAPAVLYDAYIELETSLGKQKLDLNPIGFKQVELKLGEQTGFIINQERVFCRGSVWTVEDYKSCRASVEQLRTTLAWVKRAGFNMLRLSGAIMYESQDFYRLCDEMGIMVWQDFMFSHFDYPDSDEFSLQVEQEVSQQLSRLSNHVSLVALCGASDTEQTAAMMGLPKEQWQNAIFAKQIPTLCKSYAPQIPYLRNSPIGGDFPFSLKSGMAHYWGIGAFRQPLCDLYKAPMPFLAECLGFSHIPEQPAMDAWLGEGAHFPSSNWKQGIPRDGGCSWDFDDVRDFYLTELYQLDAYQLRSYEPERYIEISKRVPGDVMAACFNEWRQQDNVCQGSLTWFLKDLWPSAGYGLIDSLGQPKAAYYALARVCQPQSVMIADRGMDGLQITVANDRLHKAKFTLQVYLLTAHGGTVAKAQCVLELEPNSQQVLALESVLGQFFDSNYQHRFGPAKHQLVVCHLLQAEKLVAESSYYPQGYNLGLNPNAVLDTKVVEFDQYYELSLRAASLVRSIAINIRGATAEDNYFTLLPEQNKIIKIQKNGDIKRFRGSISALNMSQEVKLKLS